MAIAANITHIDKKKRVKKGKAADPKRERSQSATLAEKRPCQVLYQYQIDRRRPSRFPIYMQQ
jgi:hypothetical protein